ADVRKEGPAFDLPIALGILCATGQVKPERLEEYVVAGELGLDGDVRPISGVLPMAIGARTAGKKAILVPETNAPEAAVVEGLQVYPVANLSQVAELLSGGGNLAPLNGGANAAALDEPAFPVAAPHRLGCRVDRRRQHAAARRGEPGASRRPLPGRTAGVQARRAGGAAPANGGRQRHHRPRHRLPFLPRELHVDREYEPV